jgi:RNA polymerase sigma-70 factor (ECF subfamily)
MDDVICLSKMEFHGLAVKQLEAVYRQALRLARRPDAAEELVQETYARALAARRGFRLSPRGIRPWLFRILHNAFYSDLERLRHNTAGLDRASTIAAPNACLCMPCDTLLHLQPEQLDRRLRHALAALPPEHRIVVLLWAVEGLKYRQIADVLGVALGTVMSRLHRARQMLCGQLADLAAEHGLVDTGT